MVELRPITEDNFLDAFNLKLTPGRHFKLNRLDLQQRQSYCEEAIREQRLSRDRR